MDRSSIYSEFAKLAPERCVSKLFEDVREHGVVVDILVDELRVSCNWNYMDLSVAVTTTVEADSWTSGWAAVFFLFAYLDGTNSPDAVEAFRNSPSQITWLIHNFNKVYSLMCDPALAARRSAFFDFQEKEFRQLSEIQVRALKQLPPT
jgi:hypothetical protein